MWFFVVWFGVSGGSNAAENDAGSTRLHVAAPQDREELCS